MNRKAQSMYAGRKRVKRTHKRCNEPHQSYTEKDKRVCLIWKRAPMKRSTTKKVQCKESRKALLPRMGSAYVNKLCLGRALVPVTSEKWILQIWKEYAFKLLFAHHLTKSARSDVFQENMNARRGVKDNFCGRTKLYLIFKYQDIMHSKRRSILYLDFILILESSYIPVLWIFMFDYGTK